MLEINQVALFFLILARLSAFLVTGPLFSMANIPGMVKIGLALLISMIIFPIIYQSMPMYSVDGWNYVFGLVREVLVGLALGFTASLVLSALMFAGNLIDMQIGFSMSMIFDPMASAMSGIISRFIYLLGLVVLLAFDGHHMILAAIVRSFEVVPLNSAVVAGNAAMHLIKVSAHAISIGVQIAAPIIAVMLIIDVTLGLLARTAPQINVFMLGFPIKIIFGLITLSIMVPVLVRIIYSLCGVIEEDIVILLKGMT